MNDNQREMMRHALGLTSGNQPIIVNNKRCVCSYRNHYNIYKECSDYNEWTELVTQGLAEINARSAEYFHCTYAGATAVIGQNEFLSTEDFPQASGTVFEVVKKRRS